MSMGKPSGAVSVVSSPPSIDAGAVPRNTLPASDRLSALKVYCLRCSPWSSSFLTSGNRSAFVFGIGRVLPQLTPEGLQRLRVGVLVRLVAHDQVGDRRARRLVVGHLVDPALLQAPGGLEHEVVEQVEHEVAAVVDVGARPWVARGVDGQRALGADQVVVDVAGPSAIASGVAPPLPGSSSGLVAFPLYCGDPSSSRAIVVAISSTWRDLLGAHAVQQVPVRLRRGAPRKLNAWNRYCIIVRISPN